MAGRINGSSELSSGSISGQGSPNITSSSKTSLASSDLLGFSENRSVVAKENAENIKAAVPAIRSGIKAFGSVARNVVAYCGNKVLSGGSWLVGHAASASKKGL